MPALVTALRFCEVNCRGLFCPKSSGPKAFQTERIVVSISIAFAEDIGRAGCGVIKRISVPPDSEPVHLTPPLP